MNTWRVTLVDQHWHRQILLLHATTRAAAEGLAYAMFGAPVYMAAVRQPGAGGPQP